MEILITMIYTAAMTAICIKVMEHTPVSNNRKRVG